MPRLFRTFLIAACALAAWVVTAPAWAASAMGAGLCGQHGTSEAAPPPLMIPAEASLEQGDAPFDCEALWDSQHNLQRGQERFEWSTSATADATLPDELTWPPPGVEHIGLFIEHTAALDGVQRSLERPPRG